MVHHAHGSEQQIRSRDGEIPDVTENPQKSDAIFTTRPTETSVYV